VNIVVKANTMSSYQTENLKKSVDIFVEPKRKKYKRDNNEVNNPEPCHLCCICAENATRLDESGEMNTRFINCKLGYLTDGKQKRHRDNDKAICLVCCNKLKAQQNKFQLRHMKLEHCPFCRSHDPLAKPPILCRMPRKKKTFAEAKNEKIKKLIKELNKEKKKRKKSFGYFFEDEIMNEKKFSPLKKYKETEEIKKNRIFQNKIRLPRRRN